MNLTFKRHSPLCRTVLESIIQPLAPQGELESGANMPLLPHTRFGAAGVGTAMIRMYAATGERRFRHMAELCAFTASNRLGNKLWQDYGLSGLGELLVGYVLLPAG